MFRVYYCIIAIVAMVYPKFISKKLVLSALFLGLNVLCFIGVAHGHHVTRHTRVNYSHVPGPRGGRSGSNNGRAGHSTMLELAADHGSQTTSGKGSVSGPSGSVVAWLPMRVDLPRPIVATTLLERENVIALGSAPRAPGLGRGPPTV